MLQEATLQPLLTEEERATAAMGRGIEVARRRMKASEADEDPVRGVDHALAAIEALTLHLQHVEAEALQFAKAVNLDRPDIPAHDVPPKTVKETLGRSEFARRLRDAVNRQLRLIASDSPEIDRVNVYRSPNNPGGWSASAAAEGIPRAHMDRAFAAAAQEMDQLYVVGFEDWPKTGSKQRERY